MSLALVDKNTRLSVFQSGFELKTFQIAPDSSKCYSFVVELEVEPAIILFEAAINYDLIPFFSVAVVVNRKIKLPRPEKGYGGERRCPAEHILGSSLTLMFSYCPVFDANRRAGEWIGPSGDITGGEDTGYASLQKGIN
jgi:hypothetical protein